MLNTGDGLGEKLPATKSQMLPVTPFKPVKQNHKKKVYTLCCKIFHIQTK